MKRIFSLLVILSILLVSLMAEQAKIKDWCNVREAPAPKATVVTNGFPGQVFDIMDTHGDYYKVEIMDGDKDIGQKGWIWVGKMDLNNSKTEAIIKEPGVTMRTLPNKKGEVICAINEGASVKVLEVKATWYKFLPGWVYKSVVSLIKPKEKKK